MERTAVLHKADGTQQQVTPKNGTHFSLQELYDLLDCTTVQAVPLRKLAAVKIDGKVVKEGLPQQLLICDEEGKLNDGWRQRQAVTAQAVWDSYYGRGTDFIVAPVIVCHPKMLR